MVYKDISKKRARDKRFYKKHKAKMKKERKERLQRLYKLNPKIKFIEDVKAGHRGYKKYLLDKFNNCCLECGHYGSDLQIHHNKYIKGKEGLKFVIILCKNCHIKKHHPLPHIRIEPIKTVYI